MATSLLHSNIYVRDPAKREAALRVSAASSSAVEGIRKPFAASALYATHAKPVSRKRAKSGE